VNGGSSGGQALQVNLYYNNGTTVAHTVTASSPQSNSWTLDTINFSSFDLPNNANLSGFAISGASSSTIAEVYVDQITLS